MKKIFVVALMLISLSGFSQGSEEYLMYGGAAKRLPPEVANETVVEVVNYNAAVMDSMHLVVALLPFAGVVDSIYRNIARDSIIFKIAGRRHALRDSFGVSSSVVHDSLAASAWLKKGNSGTNAAVNFIGTTDSTFLYFRVANVPYGSLLSGVDNVSFGGNAGVSAANAHDCNSIGFSAALGDSNCAANNSIGFWAAMDAYSSDHNNSIGYSSGMNANNSSFNNFIGYLSGSNDSSSSYNDFMGYSAGSNAHHTTQSVAMGNLAGQNDSNATRCTYIGSSANSIVGGLSSATAIGYNAKIGVNNGLSLGDSVTVLVGIRTAFPLYPLDVRGDANVTGNLTVSGTIINATTPTIETGTTAPGSTPGKVGDIYIDTVAFKLYFSTGTASDADWIIAN